MHEYHMSYEAALWFPLDRGLALLSGARERRGINNGHSFVDNAIGHAKRQMKRYLHEHYEIV
jgi:hypothetical protein